MVNLENFKNLKLRNENFRTNFRKPGKRVRSEIWYSEWRFDLIKYFQKLIKNRNYHSNFTKFCMITGATIPHLRKFISSLLDKNCGRER